ncbi:MAG: pyruvate dehydrogenase (acetyl-transferring) E1 component subunit alpha [Alphaproteobacteria bacterium]|nr:pyruvate dehydrogenase (acetyl-transferring) E1 component subunit alpha [Alphaproteobacteria bacterium]
MVPPTDSKANDAEQSIGNVQLDVHLRIRRIGYIDATGKVHGALPEFADTQELIRLYRAMVLTRVFDEKAIALQRTGRLGTYASSLGQEATPVGVAAAMRSDDVLLPSFREHGAQLWRGVSTEELLLFWGGDERGNDFKGPREDFPVSVPVASHAPHAVGVALAMRLRGEDRAAVCVFGDGATSKGDFYEAINLAGVWRLPVVFVATNNQWAISVPRSAQTAAETLAQKAIAAGVEGVLVDGNDVVSVRAAVETALAKARAGDGPTLIEAETYRLGDHTTADDASRYRDDAEVSAHWKSEPLSRLRQYLTDQGAWDHDDEEALLADCAAQMEVATEAYLAAGPWSPEAIFTHLYATLPADYRDQLAALKREMIND